MKNPFLAYSVERIAYRKSPYAKAVLFILFFCALCATRCTLLYAADKSWIGSGDNSTWADQKNWLPSGVPSSADDVTIDLKDADVIADKTFEAQSLTVGGASLSAFTANDFIYATIEPSSSSDEALYIRKYGNVTLAGAGTITLRGKFKNTEESLSGEESFMFTIE